MRDERRVAINRSCPRSPSRKSNETSCYVICSQKFGVGGGVKYSLDNWRKRPFHALRLGACFGRLLRGGDVTLPRQRNPPVRTMKDRRMSAFDRAMISLRLRTVGSSTGDGPFALWLPLSPVSGAVSGKSCPMTSEELHQQGTAAPWPLFPPASPSGTFS